MAVVGPQPIGPPVDEPADWGRDSRTPDEPRRTNIVSNLLLGHDDHLQYMKLLSLKPSAQCLEVLFVGIITCFALTR